MQPEIYAALYRMIFTYGWSWKLACGVLNRRFGTGYTVRELQRQYCRYRREK